MISTMSAIAVDRIAYCLRVRRYSSRGIVAASTYSLASSRKPSGGAGSTMRSISRPFSASAFT